MAAPTASQVPPHTLGVLMDKMVPFYDSYANYVRAARFAACAPFAVARDLLFKRCRSPWLLPSTERQADAVHPDEHWTYDGRAQDIRLVLLRHQVHAVDPHGSDAR